MFFIRKNQERTLKIGTKFQANIDAGQRPLAVRVDERVRVFFIFLILVYYML